MKTKYEEMITNEEAKNMQGMLHAEADVNKQDVIDTKRIMMQMTKLATTMKVTITTKVSTKNVLSKNKRGNNQNR